MTDRKTMIDEANALGLQFPGNISNVKLQEMLQAETGEPTPIQESAPASPAIKPEELPEVADNAGILAQIASLQAQLGITDEAVSADGRNQAQINASIRRQVVAKARAAAFKKHIVTITNKDSRENDKVTTAYLAFENQYFGVARSVPLDIPVELEEALIKIALQCTMALHKDEVVNGKRTGNKITVKVKKYVVSFSNKKPD